MWNVVSWELISVVYEVGIAIGIGIEKAEFGFRMNKLPGSEAMRYQETGGVHLDFHGAVNTTLDYVAGKYGAGAIRGIFFKIGRDVYKDLRRHLADGDTAELVRHWRHFLDREGADYSIDATADGARLTIRQCPAVRHVRQLGLKLSEHFCEQTEHVNRGLCDGTDFEIVTERKGEGACVQTLRRRTK